MRGKVTDQDLTNYALNELPPEERLYVESMLAVSEECRGDVYQMIEMGELLKEGFEADVQGAKLLLNEEQRSKVLTVPRWNWKSVTRKVAAVAVLAGGLTFALTRPSFWQQGGTANQLAEAGGAAVNFYEEVRERGFATSAAELTQRLQATAIPVSIDESGEAIDWQFVATPAVCTPPIPTVAEM